MASRRTPSKLIGHTTVLSHWLIFTMQNECGAFLFLCGKICKSTSIKLTTDTSLYQAHQSCADIEVWDYHLINEISTSIIESLQKGCLLVMNDPCNINNSVLPLKDKTSLHCLQGEYMCEEDREREQALQKFWEIQLEYVC